MMNLLQGVNVLYNENMKESQYQPEAFPVPAPVVYGEEQAVFTRLDAELGVDEEATEKLLDEMDSYFARHGGTPELNLGSYIQRVSGEHPEIVVRRERPEKLFDALESGEMLAIRPRKDSHASELYPNAGELGWDGSGLRIPYERGFGKVGEGKVVMVVGFMPNPEHLRNMPLPSGEYAHYTDPNERSKIRMVEGDVDPVNDLRFVIVRIPRTVFPESKMTPEELDQETVFYISRAYSFGTGANKKEVH